MSKPIIKLLGSKSLETIFILSGITSQSSFPFFHSSTPQFLSPGCLLTRCLYMIPAWDADSGESCKKQKAYTTHIFVVVVTSIVLAYWL